MIGVYISSFWVCLRTTSNAKSHVIPFPFPNYVRDYIKKAETEHQNDNQAKAKKRSVLEGIHEKGHEIKGRKDGPELHALFREKVTRILVTIVEPQ